MGNSLSSRSFCVFPCLRSATAFSSQDDEDGVGNTTVVVRRFRSNRPITGNVGEMAFYVVLEHMWQRDHIVGDGYFGLGFVTPMWENSVLRMLRLVGTGGFLTRADISRSDGLAFMDVFERNLAFDVNLYMHRRYVYRRVNAHLLYVYRVEMDWLEVQARAYRLVLRLEMNVNSGVIRLVNYVSQFQVDLNLLPSRDTGRFMGSFRVSYRTEWRYALMPDLRIVRLPGTPVEVPVRGVLEVPVQFPIYLNFALISYFDLTGIEERFAGARMWRRYVRLQ